MRVLWLCNVMLPIVGKDINRPFSNSGGWLDGLSNDIISDEKTNIELAVTFPISFQDEMLSGEIALSGNRSLHYFGFPIFTTNESVYDQRTETYLSEIVRDFNPDVIHIFGTEFAHSLAMTRVAPDVNRIVVSIQGVMSVYAEKYTAKLPSYIVKRYTLRDMIRRDNVCEGQKKFLKRAEFEKETLGNITHVVGRTHFDKLETKRMNPNRIYHKVNETLRTPFYEREWDLNKVEKHSIMYSQGNYPIKGLHFMLVALAEVKKEFPDVKLYVAGDKIVPGGSLKSRLKVSSYGKYLHDLINEYEIEGQVIFTGSLNVDQMCDRYLKSQVFVSSSIIENSPNSVGEAMLLGMPVVSSNVGGVSSMLEDEKEGILTKEGNVEELTKAICKIFANENYAIELGKKAREHAFITHNRKTNYEDLIALYEEIGN